MCLITFAYRCHPDYSLVMLANRDEFYARPTRSMGYWADHPAVLAGQDLEQGGTWLGLGQQGQFATVTNYRNGRERQEGLRSRGSLTRTYLCREQTAGAYLNALEPDKALYGAFNLIIGDRSGLHYLSNRGGIRQTLTPGLYGLSNALLDSPWPKLRQVKSQLQAQIERNDFDPGTLLAIMQDRREADPTELPDTGISTAWEKYLSACFIQLPEYGTRATTLLLQKPNGETYIREQNYDATGTTECVEYRLSVPPIGSIPG